MRKCFFILLLFLLSFCKNDNIKNYNSQDLQPSYNEKSNVADNQVLEFVEKRESGFIQLANYIVVNDFMKSILDSLINDYEKCEKINKGYFFYISISNTMIKETLEGKQVYISIDSVDTKSHLSANSIYINRSYYKDYLSRGYGYFYYNENLFILEGLQLNDIFQKTEIITKFPYKFEPVMIFDPPRWFYCYWNKEFYLVYKSPCGG